MKNTKRASVAAAVIAAVLLGAGTARADDVELGLAFLFPIPIPVPIYKIEHEPSPVTLGLLFPIPLPVPVYDYGDHEAGPPREEEPERYGRLQTMVRPRNAAVYVDGEYRGEAGEHYFRKDSLTLRPGSHIVEFRADGYDTYKAEVYVQPGGLVNVGYDMRRSEKSP
jgi:hypothetical protein